MLETIVKQEIVFYIMSVLVIFAVIAKLISAFTVRRVVKAAGEIQKSNHRLMKLIKAKFEHASMISDKVQNVGAFVDKFLYEYRVWGVRLHKWRTMPKKVLLLTAILGVFAIFESFRVEGFGELFVMYAQWTGIFVLFLALLCLVSEESSLMQVARTYMVEYLENVCVHRYEKLHRSAKQEEKEEETVAEEKLSVSEQAIGEEPEDMKAAEEIAEEKKRNEQEIRIRAILEEFLA